MAKQLTTPHDDLSSSQKRLAGRIMRMPIQKILSTLIPRYPEIFIRLLYFRAFRSRINLQKPRTFNEKIQWSKLFAGYEKFGNLVDKVEVKKYVSQKIGEQYVPETYLVLDELNPDVEALLPDDFVIKPTHTSGDVIIINHKANMNFPEVRKLSALWKKINFYYLWFESVYKNITPRIIIEENLTYGNDILKDYKFYCFRGKVEYIHVDFNRFSHHTRNVYSRDWQLQNFSYKFPSSNEFLAPPKLEDMISIAEQLSQNFPFLRVDLYYTPKEEIKFGELTFFPESGFGKFHPPVWDLKLGELYPHGV